MNSSDYEDARRLVIELGVEPDQIPLEAELLPELAADAVFDQGKAMSRSTFLAHLGDQRERAAAFLRALGVPVDDEHARFGDSDLRLAESLVASPTEWIADDELLEAFRVMHRSLSAAAEAAISVHVRKVDPRGVTASAWVTANTAMARYVDLVAEHLGTAWRHHLRAAIATQRRPGNTREYGELLDLAIGFVDVVGYTALARELGPSELVEWASRLERAASDAAAEHDVRLVKLIGDEVMFAGPVSGDVARCMLQLVQVLSGQEVSVHAGLSAGQVVMLHGDYYGTAVNLAARLCSKATAGEMWVDQATASSVDLPHRVVSPVELRGFPHPIPVATLTAG